MSTIKNDRRRRRDFSALHVLQLRAASRNAKTTPAVAAGVTEHIWSLEEIVGLLNLDKVNDSN